MNTSIRKSASSGWLNLDIWSEPYIGAYWIVKNELPKNQYECSTHHGPLSQMVLITSHHLNEVIFFQCVHEIINKSPNKYPSIMENIERAKFRKSLEKWPSILVGKPFNLEEEPYSSVIRLAERRNETIHKESALTSLEMARSALYSACVSSEAIAKHLLGEQGFKYSKILQKYKLEPVEMFSKVVFPESYYGHNH